MGRWGSGIYDSDASLDFFDTIMDRISRDISFWFSPEQVDENAEWLREVLTLIEIRLIFDAHEIGTTVDFNISRNRCETLARHILQGLGCTMG